MRSELVCETISQMSTPSELLPSSQTHDDDRHTVTGEAARKSPAAAPPDLPSSLARVREAVNSLVRRCLASAGITEAQWRILDALENGDERAISAIARDAGLSSSSASRILRELQGRGMISFLRDSGGRVRLAKLTPAGRSLFDRLASSMAEIDSQIVRLVGRNRLVHLQSLLDELERRLH